MSFSKLHLASCGLGTYFLCRGRFWPLKTKDPCECCGIVGYVGSKDAQVVLMEGVKILQNRGYDSCGISTISSDGVICTTKFASRDNSADCVELLSSCAAQNHAYHHIGVGHTRWATHGSKTDTNAHPHHDYKDRLSIVHNGTILNFLILKEELKKYGIPFRSETDSEVIVNLISWYMDQNNDLLKAVTLTVNRLQGTWGFALLSKDSREEIIIARNGSPLLIGCSEDEVFFASEASAFVHYTNQFVGLNDGEVCVVNPTGIRKLIESRDLYNIDVMDVELSPTPHAHWTIKEILEQPLTVERALNFGGRLYPIGYRVKLGGLEQNSDILFSIKNLLITGCGTSLFAGMYGEILMCYLGGFETVQTLDAGELTVERLPQSSRAGILLLSQSGETLDTIRAYKIGASKSIPCFSIVNCVGSQLARLTNLGVYSNAGREVAVASTKAFTSQVIVLALIATWFAQHHNTHRERRYELMGALCRLPISISKIFEELTPYMKLAEKLKSHHSVFILGKGLFYPVALEGALKLKEMSYIHSEAFSTGALKHGPLALIDSMASTPVVLICSVEENLEFHENTASQLKARGAYVIGIIDDDKALNNVCDTRLVIPKNGSFTPLLAAISLQLIAYYLAVARGINPDKPRCLAKTVTVF